MNDLVTCPKCGGAFQLSQAMQASLTEEANRIREQAEIDARARFEREAAEQSRVKDEELAGLRKKADEAAVREAELLRRKRELEDRERQLGVDLEKRVADESAKIRIQVEQAAKERYEREAAEQSRAKDEELAALRKKAEEASTREAELLRKKRELDEKERQLGVDLETRVADESAKIRVQVEQAAKERHEREAAEQSRAKDEELAALRKRADEAATREVEILRLQRELDDKRRQIEIDAEKWRAEEATRIREQLDQAAKERVELQLRKSKEEIEKQLEEQKLRDQEREVREESLRKKVEELQKKLEQGSQQVQGEAQEEALKDLLSRAFSSDGIEDVAKGVQGADLMQRVMDGSLDLAGTILWESKRTRNWNDEWLAKLKDDQREAGADCCVIVSQVLPPNVRHFARKDGVWICDFGHAVPLAVALRAGLIDVSRAKRIAEGRGEKAQMLYDYLTGPDFQNRVNGVVEAFDDLRTDLRKEQMAMAKLWKKREGQLHRAAQNLAAMFGSVQGIAGKRLADIDALGLPGPDEEASEEDAEVASERGPEDPQLMELLFGLIPEDGSSVGNKSLSERFTQEASQQLQLAVTDQDYERCRQGLLDQKRIQRGKGRGGAVLRAPRA